MGNHQGMEIWAEVGAGRKISPSCGPKLGCGGQERAFQAAADWPWPRGSQPHPPWRTTGDARLTRWWPGAQDPAGGRNNSYAAILVIPPGKRLKPCPGGPTDPSFWAPLHHVQPQLTCSLGPDFLGPDHTLRPGCCAATLPAGLLSDAPCPEEPVTPMGSLCVLSREAGHLLWGKDSVYLDQRVTGGSKPAQPMGFR